MTVTENENAILTVGWREWVRLPELGIPHIKAKVDTGARTSALHAFELETFEDGGENFVKFAIHPLQNNTDVVHTCTAPIVDQRMVTDSGGHTEERFVIRSPIVLAGKTWPAEITLTCRDTMKFRMLLGRTAMAGRLVVDPAASFIHGRPKRSEREPEDRE